MHIYTYTVTFGQKFPKLNSRLIYCSQLYGIRIIECLAPCFSLYFSIFLYFLASDTNIGAANGLADLEEHYGQDYAMDLIKGKAIEGLGTIIATLD